MKKLLFLFLLFLLVVPAVASATHGPLHLNLEYPKFGEFDLNESKGQSFDGLIGWLYYAIIGISGLAAFVMLIWGGIRWMSSAGDPTATSDAKDRIKQALLGLLLVLSSFIIIQIINPELTILKDPLSGVTAPQTNTQSSGTTPNSTATCAGSRPTGKICEGGAWVTQCIDTDGGTNKTKKGVCTDVTGGFYEDSCSPKTIEFQCVNNRCHGVEAPCLAPFTCNAGACVSSIVCKDTDGGLDRTKRGVCTDASTSSTTTFVDACGSGNNLHIEFYCKNNECTLSAEPCPAGQICKDDACVSATSIPSSGVTVDIKATLGASNPIVDSLVLPAPKQGDKPTVISFTWTSTNADKCSITDFNRTEFDVPIEGRTNITFQPIASTNYRLSIECLDTGGLGGGDDIIILVP